MGVGAPFLEKVAPRLARMRASLEQCIKLAAKLDLSQPTDEASRIFPRLKKDAALAITHDLGIALRTAVSPKPCFSLVPLPSRRG